MTAYQVDVHHVTHTCPANQEPHPYDTRRIIVAVAPGGPCRFPVTIRSGDTTTVIACGRHMPRERQCPACRITVIEHAVTVTHIGAHTPASQPMPTGLTAEPCRVCGGPLAAVLADHGTHLLCHPRHKPQQPALDHGTAA
jgi:hypothetical protein